MGGLMGTQHGRGFRRGPLQQQNEQTLQNVYTNAQLSEAFELLNHEGKICYLSGGTRGGEPVAFSLSVPVEFFDERQHMRSMQLTYPRWTEFRVESVLNQATCEEYQRHEIHLSGPLVRLKPGNNSHSSGVVPATREFLVKWTAFQNYFTPFPPNHPMNDTFVESWWKTYNRQVETEYLKAADKVQAKFQHVGNHPPPPPPPPTAQGWGMNHAVASALMGALMMPPHQAGYQPPQW